MGRKKRAGDTNKAVSSNKFAVLSSSSSRVSSPAPSAGPPAPPPVEARSEPEPEVLLTNGRVDSGVLASALSVEFPLIDPSLVHAILLDYDPDTIANHLDTIRDQLGILEATSVPDIDETQAPTDPYGSQRSASLDHSNDADGTDALSSWLGVPSTTASTTCTTPPPPHSYDSGDIEDDPQTEHELLSSFFPNMSKKSIDDALETEPSLDAAIDHLLSVELIEGVQKTGMWPDAAPVQESEGEFIAAGTHPGTSSRPHSRNNSAAAPPPRPKAKKATTMTIPLVDTLQRRATRPTRPGSASGSSTPRTPIGPAADVWSSFASLAAYLSEILPRAQAAFFTSYLHSPDYGCAHEAVLSALSVLAAAARIDVTWDEAISILEDIYGYSLDDEAGHDLNICVRASEADVAVVMDLMDLLTELTWWPDYQFSKTSGSNPFSQLAELEKALPPRTPTTPQFQTTQSPTAVSTRVQSADRLQRPKSDPPTKRERVVPGSRPAAGGFTSATPLGRITPGRWALPATANNSTSWQQVANRRPTGAPSTHPLAASIPAYARGMLPQDQRPGALAAAQRFPDLSSANDEPTIEQCYARSSAEWRRREEAIRSAGRHFKTAGRRNVSGAVAAHYAATARAAGAAAREWELRGARLVVETQMERSIGHTVDLHYATVEQAGTLAREAAERWWSAVEAERIAGTASATGTRPLVVVTGKGRHSAGQRGVLGPAVAKVLSDSGWRIDRYEGYVVVKGRQ